MKFTTAKTAGVAPGLTDGLAGARRLTAFVLFLMSVAIAGPLPAGQAVYKYRDDSGRWVLTDRRPDDRPAAEFRAGDSSPASEPAVTVLREETAGGVVVRVANGCACPAEYALMLVESENADMPAGAVLTGVVGSGATVDALSLSPVDPAAPLAINYRFGYVFGDPLAVHRAAQPYRPPFGAAAAYRVSQAFPDRITHNTPDSFHAVDIAMPEQTGVFAARGGIVVSAAYSHFRGGADRSAYGAKANHVRILHNDGTFGLYAHLSWDSIRVRVGQRVRRGEYIADSGNTGFSTGPHLHFAVLRNAGMRLESVPLTFTSGPGEAAAPRTGGFLRNP